MQDANFFRAFREQILLSINTCFPAKVLSFDGKETKIQPLFMSKNYNEAPQQLAVIEGVPVLRQRYKVNGGTPQVYEPVLQTGDVVLCVCAQRSLDDALAGKVYYAGKARVLSVQDAVIVGVM